MIITVLTFVAGVVIGGGAVIVFGKNNKNKVTAARAFLVEKYEKVDPDIRNKLDEILS